MKKIAINPVRYSWCAVLLLMLGHSVGCSANNERPAPDFLDTGAYIRWVSTSDSEKAIATRASLSAAPADLKKSIARARAAGIEIAPLKWKTASVEGNAAPLLGAWQKDRVGMSPIPQFMHGLAATKTYTSEQLSLMRAIVSANAPYDKLLYRAANMPYREFVHRGPELMSIFDAADLLNIEAFVFAKDGNYTRSLECLQYGASLATQSGPNSSVGVDPYPGFAEYLTNMGFAEEVLLNSRNLLIFAGPNKPVAKAVQRIVDELSPDIDFKTAWIKESASFSQIFRKWRSVPVSKLGDDMQQTLGHEGQVSDDITPTPSEKTLARAALDRAESEYLDNAAAILNGYAESTDRGEKVTNNVESKLGSLKDASSPTSITVLLQYEPLRIMHIGMKRRTAEALITKAAAYALEIKAASGKYPSSLPANLLGHTLNVTIHYSCVGDSQITISSIVQYSKDELKINRPTVKDFVYKQ